MFTATYTWFLKTFRFKEPITLTIRRWQTLEPIVFLLTAALAGLWVGSFAAPRELLFLGSGLLAGILAGHFWW